MNVQGQVVITLIDEELSMLLSALLASYETGKLDEKETGFVIGLCELLGAEFDAPEELEEEQSIH